MKQTLLFLFSFLVISVQAQLTYMPEVITASGEPTSTDIKADFEVANNTSEAISAYWTIDRGDVPAEWEFSLCDKITCYAYGVETSPSSKPNDFGANESFPFFSLHTRPNGVSGSYTATIIFYSTVNSTEVYTEIPITITALSTSTIDIDVRDITLYPNPTSDFFQISNDDNIDYISVHSVLGKRVFETKHETDKAYNISDLNKGMYMVRMFNKNGDVIKVVRLSKR